MNENRQSEARLTRRRAAKRKVWAFVIVSIAAHALALVVASQMGLWDARAPVAELDGRSTSVTIPEWDTACLLQEGLATTARLGLCAAPGWDAPADCAKRALHRQGLGRLACRRVEAPETLAFLAPVPEQPAGQVVEIARPELEAVPAEAEFSAEYDSAVERQTRSRLPPSLETSPSTRQGTASEPARAVSQAQPPVPDRAARAGGSGEALAMRSETPRPNLQGTERGETELDDEGAFQQQGGQDSEPSRPGPPDEAGTDGRPGTPSLMPTSEDLARSIGSGRVDDIDGIEEGAETLLNTRRYKYATFFNRVKRSVFQSWAPAVGTAYRLRDPSGKIYGNKNRETILMVTLAPRGNLEDVVIIEPSGVGFLDDVAVQAFRRAQPFPNPPDGLVDPGTQRITFKFGFRLEVDSPSMFKVFRY